MKHAKEIKAYFQTLSDERKHFVAVAMVEKALGLPSTQSNNPGGNCGTKPTNSPTPNGEWVCRDNQWVWIAEIG